MTHIMKYNLSPTLLVAATRQNERTMKDMYAVRRLEVRLVPVSERETTDS